MTPCKCGGEPQLESFTLGKKPRVYFVRCWACETIGPEADTPQDAETRWDEQQEPKDKP